MLLRKLLREQPVSFGFQPMPDLSCDLFGLHNPHLSAGKLTLKFNNLPFVGALLIANLPESLHQQVLLRNGVNGQPSLFVTKGA
ncbi:MAG: hypothetical protein HONBIEJF_00989 [Fimbriimonadaceae bacterium]|nr:hypothetical protein [Fimbriimonadaceae bacterium]